MEQAWGVLWASRLRKFWQRDRLKGFWGKLCTEIAHGFPGRTAVAYGAADVDSSRKGDWAAALMTSRAARFCPEKRASHR